jgi:predicted DNA-binding ribbon-helix-helix protein
MKSSIIKHSIVIAGRKTSVSLERTFWDSLREIAKERNEALSKLVETIDAYRQLSNLSSAIRLFVLDYYRNRQNEMVVSPSLDPNSISDEGSV